MLTFLKAFGEKKVRDAGNSFVAFLAQVDFEAVSEAQIGELEEVLDTLAEKMASQKQKMDKEQKEADAELAKYNKKLEEASKIDEAIKDAKTPYEKKEKFEAELLKRLDEIETLKPNVDRELEEAVEARAYFDELKEATRIASENVKNAKKALADKKQQLDRVKLEASRQKDREDQVKVLAGIKQQASSLGTVINVLEKEIDKTKQQVEKSKIKTDLLRPASSEIGELDPDVAAVLGTKTNVQSSANAPDLSERLAKLKAGK